MTVEVTLKFESLEDAGNFLLTASGSVAGDGPHVVAPAAQSEPTQKTTRGRGRPARGETQIPAPGAAVSTASPAVAESVVGTAAAAGVAGPDPFAVAPQTPAEPTYTKDDVAAAGRSLGAATTQEHAVAVMKAATGVGSFGSLEPHHYGLAVKAFQNALAAVKPATPAVEADPFGPTPQTGQGAPAAAEDHPSEADLKKAALAVQKRCSEAQIAPVLIAHGGFQATTQGTQPSLKAVPLANRAALIKAFAALPSTK